MAILARVLMLVACVPLLQPPGFCVCKAAGSGRTSPSQKGSALANSSPAPTKGCCSRRSPNDPVTSATTESPAPTPCPAPADDDHHLPGCPASVGVDRFKWVEPAQSFSDSLPAVDPGSFLPLDVVLPVAVRLIPPALISRSLPPIYLTYCSLVI